ncbi:Hypothetical predicted protein [Cloeon dipterum]|uniref:Peptidase C14A caspase catalytic domain-containing protein n=1 Tax=Cloeon dipterum TaxID=197152 RepID=A0A8S1CG39_9INSE|nr:Hypothetical predicted protein [Cloeon dipterum]
METEGNYFAYCLDTKTRINYFIVPSKYLKPRPNARHSNPGVAWNTLGQKFWGGVFQSAWHESLEVDPSDGSFLDQKSDKDFGKLLTEAEYKECLVLATASSVQELQQHVQTCIIKVPNEYRRLEDSIASGSQQHDKPQKQNQSNQQPNNEDEDNSMASTSLGQANSTSNSVNTGATPIVTLSEDDEIVMEDPTIDVPEYDERGDTHIRPEGIANLGFFEYETDGIVTRKNADNVCVLVIHYKFKDNPLETFRNGDTCDVANLKTFFGQNRNCNFRNLQSPDKKTLLQLLGDEEKLLQFFNTQDDVPSVFVLFILSHGDKSGTIATDHFDGGDNEYFTTDDVFDSLQRLKKFEKCLKIVNFGPCRGSLDDSKFNLKNSYTKYANRNSCRITTRPGMQNFVVFYSTVETTMANTNKNGSWFVRNICLCLNNVDDEPLLKFFTNVQSRMHQTSRNYRTFDNTPQGQTPELKMFTQERRFIISKTKTTAILISSHDASWDKSKVRNKPISANFSWKSDEEQDIRGRKGFILSVVHSKEVQELIRVLQNLDFETKDWTLSGQSMNFYNKIVAELEPDVGCTMTFIFGPVCVNKQKEVCVRLGQKTHPITNILHSLVGPKNDRLIGKPKILIVVNVEAPQTDNTSVDIKDLQVSATNHSGWLVLILKYEDAFEKLIELFRKISEKNLQELLEPLLTRESKRGDVVLLNSTLQYLIEFPNLPRKFLKPDFKIQKKKIIRFRGVRLKKSFQSFTKVKIDFDTLTGEARRLFDENKNSIETQLKTNPVRDFRVISPAKEIAQKSIVWLFNSVAGAGKSTVLVEMAHQLTKYDEGFKILRIPLKKHYRYLFGMPAMKLNEIEFLVNTTCNSHVDIKNWIEKRKLVVFLDGFDEMCPQIRNKIIIILIALNKANVPLFVGTRPHEVHHIQGRIKNTTIVEIEPLDESKQIEFLQTVAGMNLPEIENLRKIFKDQDILGNPLYLTLLAEYSGDGNLYEIFEKIVRRKVEICLVRENGDKHVGEETIDKSLKLIHLVAYRFLIGVKIDQNDVSKKDLERINAFGFVSYDNDRVDFIHQMFAEFLAAQKFIYELKNPEPEKVPLFNDELVQCRKFVDLFFSTEKAKEACYADAFIDWAKYINPLKLVSQICRENLIQMFKLLDPDLSLEDNDGKNSLHFALRHFEMVKMVHQKNSTLATKTNIHGENCLHLAIADDKCSEEVALWIMKNTEVDKNAETKIKDTPILLASARQKWEVAQQLIEFTNVQVNKSSPDGKSILHYSVMSNKLNFVLGLLDRGAIINLQDSSGETPLHIAAGWSANPEIVENLLQRGAEVETRNKEMLTALHLAARYNPVPEIIQTLLEHGADVHSQDEDGLSALHQATRHNENPDILKILLDFGANLNAQDSNKRTALHYSAENKQAAEVVQKLFEYGADLDSQDQYGMTPLHHAAGCNKNAEMVKILLEKGAKVNSQDNNKQTALHHAIDDAKFANKVIQQLLENGADIDSKDQEGYTALHLAAGCEWNPEMVKILLEKGANVKSQDKNKRTPLHHFVETFYPIAEVVQKLLENGADVDSQDQAGCTALHLAAGCNQNLDTVQILLENGAKVNLQDKDKWTALHFAVRFNTGTGMVLKLIENGFDVNSRTLGGKSALHMAAERNYPEVVNILIEKGANVNARDDNTWTALHCAARFSSSPDVVQKLLDKGADVNLESANGVTALFLAAKYNPVKEVIQTLRYNGAEVNKKIRNDKKCVAVLLEMGIDPQLLKNSFFSFFM